MIRCHTRKWGNSLGIIIPKDAVEKYGLHPHEDITIEVTSKTNVLKELFGSGKSGKSTEDILRRARKELKSKR